MNNEDLHVNLEALGGRVRHGLTRMDPVPDKTMRAVREAVIAQWEQNHPKSTQSVDKQAEQSTSQTQSQANQQEQSNPEKQKSQSHEDGHSY
jgi:hypothetical protein